MIGEGKIKLFGSEDYKKSVEEIIKQLDSSVTKGLPKFEVDEKRKRYGFNRVEAEKPPSFTYFFLDHALEFVSILLISISIVSFSTYVLFTPTIERLAEGFIVTTIVLISIFSGAYQDHKSEKTAHKLKKMVMMSKVTVLRNGSYKEVDSEELVPGDIVLLKTGDKVPADIRLIKADDLEIQESNLTGEGRPSIKHSRIITEDKPISGRENMAYMNTYVTRGNGKGVVVAIGTKTEFGLISEQSKEVPKHRAPFLDEIQSAARKISYFALVLVFLSSITFHFYGRTNYQVFMLAAALVIGAIPAALPITVTYSLTHSMKMLARKNVLVKNLPFLTSVGSVDVICTAKTGTLTESKMSVQKIFLPGHKETLNPKSFDKDESYELIRCALLTNEAEFNCERKEYIGDPKDIGLLEFLKSKGVNVDDILKEYYVKGFLPFSSDKMITQALVKLDKDVIRYSKGRPKTIVSRCSKILVNGEIKDFTDGWKNKVKKVVSEFSKYSLNNLAFSCKYVKKEGLGEHTKGDVFIGVVGVRDSVRHGVRDAIETCYGAGIEIKMITGDDKKTAISVAKECGFRNIRAINWNEIKNASEEELKEIVSNNNVFAEMDPMFKIEVVKTLHKIGKKVAITGDGINDTPAMHAAEVGIAMGKHGSDIVKDAADIILLDDSFPSIKEAIKYGRTSLSNVKKLTNYLLTANFFEVIVLFLASLAGFTPLRAIQILWVNFATDVFPAVGLSTDPPHPDIMKKKPVGKREKILTKRVRYMLVGMGIKKVAIVFLVFFIILFLSNGETTIFGIRGDLVLAQASVFAWLGVFHIDRIIAIRWDEGWKWKDVFINKTVNYALLWPILTKFIILYTPLCGFALSGFFHAKPLPIWVWAIISILLLLSVVLAVILVKIITKQLGKYSDIEY
ncbi:MAG: cation-transporting P-type ATPase [Candidatus Woesearchaeota archaeon]|nr:MAG: cation-transporting P-type ATPase [Candidatus Woesearchaeota archaeon]